MVFTELLPGNPAPGVPAVPLKLYHLTNGTRSYSMIEQLQANDTGFGYIDDPDNRWIISIEQWVKGIGFMVVYKTDKDNFASEVGHALFGFQDTVRTIIRRSRTHVTEYETPLDLNPIILA